MRTCALGHISGLEEARSVLRDEVTRYNQHQVHSTTGQIPDVRFAEAQASGHTLFRPFVLPKPYRDPQDVFCLQTTRVMNGYRRLSLFGQKIDVPQVPPRIEVEIHLVPDFFQTTDPSPDVVVGPAGAYRERAYGAGSGSSLLNFRSVHFSAWANTRRLTNWQWLSSSDGRT